MNFILKRKYIVLLTITLACLIVSCSDTATSIDPTDDNTDFEVSKTTIISIFPDERYQTIRSFGASDADATEYIGENWPKSQKEKAAQLLFSKELDNNGNPLGIGLSGWRFQIGSGSARPNSGIIPSSWFRSIQCFMNQDGSYNWDRQKGSQWFLRKAYSYGVKQVVAWSVSPPFFMTKSGYSYRTPGISGYNLSADKYDDYADFLATVASHFEKEGTPINFISPLNEPQYPWTFEVGEAKRGGSKASNEEIANLVDVIDSTFSGENIDSKILIPEAGAINYLYTGNNVGAGDQINAFWNTSSSNYVGDLSNVANYIAGHSYWTNGSVSESINHRKNLLKKLNQVNPNVQFWQTEYSLLGNSYLEDRPRTSLKSIDYALWIARIVHNDLTYANASSWSFWLAFNKVNNFTSNSDKRPLRFGLAGWDPDIEDKSTSNGTIHAFKNLWAFGNFSRFIRPGMQRVKVKNKTYSTDIEAGKNVMASAYIDSDESKIVIVLINYSDENQKIDFENLGNGFSIDGNFDVYTTSEYRNLDHSFYGKDNVKILSKSITTLVGKTN